MPVDRAEIRKLAADPSIALMIQIIELFFNKLYAESLRACPDELAGETKEQKIEQYWQLLKEGALRLYDEDIDDEDANVVGIFEAATPGQQERARVVGGKLFAVRQLMRRAA
jgi:hypothetical protein